MSDQADCLRHCQCVLDEWADAPGPVCDAFKGDGRLCKTCAHLFQCHREHVENMERNRYDIDKVAFEGPKTPDRGYTMRVSYLKPPASADALVEVMKNGSVVRAFLFPAYKIYNLQAHFTEIVNSEIDQDDNGYRQAAWNGIGPV